MPESKVKVAAVQAAPVFLDLEASLQKALGLIEKAAAEGARLLVFPEAFLPAWPAWVDEVLPGEDKAWHVRLLEQSVVVPRPVTERLGAAARTAGVHLVMGVDEREEHASTIYNTMLSFDADGRLLGKHRKLVPTHAERLVWGMGDGSDLKVHQTAVGRVGGLICWENYMPLARFAMYAQGVDIWVAPTLATHDPWVASMRHIAREGVCHVIGVGPAARFSEVPDSVPDRERLWRGVEPHGDWMLDGYSVIVDPGGPPWCARQERLGRPRGRRGNILPSRPRVEEWCSGRAGVDLGRGGDCRAGRRGGGGHAGRQAPLRAPTWARQTGPHRRPGSVDGDPFASSSRGIRNSHEPQPLSPLRPDR